LKKRSILIILLLLTACSTQKKNLVSLRKDLPRTQTVYIPVSLEKRAFYYKLQGKYSASYNLFKELILNNINYPGNTLYLEILRYLAEQTDNKKDLSQYAAHIDSQVTNRIFSDSIKYCLMYHYLSSAPEKSQKIRADLGFINDFYMIGPFKNENREGMQIIYPPEIEITLNRKYIQSVYHPVKWKHIQTEQPDGINLTDYFTPDENGVVYLLSYIHATNSQRVEMIYGSDDGIKIWLNDQLIINEDIYRQAYIEQNRRSILLKKGINKILIKSSQESGAWKLYFRIYPVQYRVINSPNSIKNFTENTELIPEIEPDTLVETLTNNFLKGLYYQITGNFPDTDRLNEKHFELYLRENPADPVAHLYYAKAVKEKTIAKDHYEECLQILPSAVEAISDIAWYYYDLKQYDKALEYLDRIPEDFTGAFYLKALIFFNNNLYPQSLQSFKKCEIKNIDLFQTYYWMGEIYWDNKEYKKAYEYYLLSFYEAPHRFNLFYGNDLINYLVALDRQDEILSLIEHSRKIKRDDPGLLNGFSIFYLNRGDLKKAEELINDSLKLDNYDPLSLMTASDIMIALQQTNRAISYLQRILENDIHNKAIKRRLQILQKKTTDMNTIVMPDINKIIKRSFTGAPKKYRKKYKKSSGLICYDGEIIQVSQSGTTEKLITRIYYIVNDSGIKNFKNEVIDYSPDHENIEIKTAKTVYRDGKEYNAHNIQEYSLINEEENLYYKYNRKVISFPKLKKDSILVLQYSVWSKNETIFKKTYFGEMTINAHFYPVLQKDYAVIVPKGTNIMKLYYRYDPPSSGQNFNIKTYQDRKIYKWQFTDLPPLQNEDPMPPIETIAPTLSVSTFKTWDQVGEWIWKLSQEGVRLNAEMKKFISGVKSGSEDKKEEIIKTIYKFVRDEIRYVGIEYGIGGIKPRNTIATWTSKYGDCKDKALLLHTLLKEFNIESYFALVRTRGKGKSEFQLPLLGVFDHAVCVVPIKNTYLFLDGTASYFDLNEFPSFDRENRIFLIKQTGSTFIDPPAYKKDENLHMTIITNLIRSDNSMESTVLNFRSGQFMPSLRYFSTDKENHIKEIESYWNSILPGSKLTRLNYHLEMNMFQYKMEVNSFLTGSKNRYKFTPVLNRIQLYRYYCNSTKRKYDIVMEHPFSMNATYIYKLEEDPGQIVFPKNKLINNPILMYSIKYLKNKNTITVKRIFQLKKERIKAKEYPAFKKACSEIDKCENNSIELIKE